MDFDDLDARPIKPRPPLRGPSRYLKSSNPPRPPLQKSEPQEINSDALVFNNNNAKEQVQELEEHDVKPKPVLSGINGGNASGSAAMDGMEVDDDLLTEDFMNVDDVEEDYVVREIDVFFNPSIGANAQIFVMQYPLRPRWRPYEFDERCQEVRVKPKSIEVEIDLSIDTRTPKTLTLIGIPSRKEHITTQNGPKMLGWTSRL